MFNAQSLQIQPRDGTGKDPRLARTDTSLLREENGIFYKKIPKVDYGRYKVLTEQEELEEMARTNEIQQSMLTVSGATKQIGKIRTRAPMFGGSSRKTQIESKRWDKSIKSATSGQLGASSTISRLVNNSAKNNGIEG